VFTCVSSNSLDITVLYVYQKVFTLERDLRIPQFKDPLLEGPYVAANLMTDAAYRDLLPKTLHRPYL
jgi:hypothetical protein